MPANTNAMNIVCKECEKAVSNENRTLHLNMLNLGNTCYMSSTVMCLYHLDSVRTFVNDSSHEQRRPDRDSGRNPLEFLTRSYGSPDAQHVEALSAQHVAKASKFLQELRTLFSRFEQTAESIQWTDAEPFVSALMALDWEEWKRDEQNDSADVLMTALETMVVVTDSSTQDAARLAKGSSSQPLRNRGLLCKLDEKSFDIRVRTRCCRESYCQNCLRDHLKGSDERCPNCKEPCHLSAVESVRGISKEETQKAHDGMMSLQ